MDRSQGGAKGFEGLQPRVASFRLLKAVAVSLALGALSVSLIVTLTALSIRTSLALPI